MTQTLAPAANPTTADPGPDGRPFPGRTASDTVHDPNTIPAPGRATRLPTRPIAPPSPPRPVAPPALAPREAAQPVVRRDDTRLSGAAARPVLDGVVPDLRRAVRREQIQLLLDRAELAELPANERALLHAAFVDGHSAIEIAALARSASGAPVGGEVVTARSVRRRIRRLVERVMSPRFLYVVRHQGAWPQNRRRVAEACVLRGLSLRDAAAELGLSLHVVRRQHEVIETLFDAASRPASY